MLALFAKVTVKPELVDRFWKYLEADAIGSRGEEGCIRFDILRDEKAANVFYLYEVYLDHAAYGAHQEAPYFKQFFAEAGDTLAVAPEVQSAVVVAPIDAHYWPRPS
jgi:quinol monooxygenase YgiN